MVVRGEFRSGQVRQARSVQAGWGKSIFGEAGAAGESS
jgi:hypothetical protein